MSDTLTPVTCAFEGVGVAHTWPQWPPSVPMAVRSHVLSPVERCDGEAAGVPELLRGWRLGLTFAQTRPAHARRESETVQQKSSLCYLLVRH